MTYTIEYIRQNNLIIFETIAGSKAYGTATPESDTDIRGVFVQPLSDLLAGNYVDQVSDEKNDITFYELRRFMALLSANNPNIIEMLGMPGDCIVYKHPLFEMIEANLSNFLTKSVRDSFGGYAIAQIKKAQGYNKKMNWEATEMVRKNVLDFCYVIQAPNSDTILFTDWVNRKYDGYDNYNFGLSKINHAHDLYALFDLSDFYGIQGIVKDLEKSNNVQTVSIPKGLNPVAYLSFNKDAYSTHCKRYSEYLTWLKERNPNRIKMNKSHGKNYDSKNMMHTYRLLLMAKELADGVLQVRRSPQEIEKLMKIRKGEFEYEDLLREANSNIKLLDDIYEKSNLPAKVNKKLVGELILTIRKEFYSLP